MLPSQAITLICVSSIFPTLSVIAVCLRIYARRLKKVHLDGSDYMIFFTLLNAVLNAIACIIGAAACGIGLPLSQLNETLQVRFLKILFVTQFFYVFSVWSVKASVLLFYYNIFPTTGFRRAVFVTQFFLLAWLVAFFFVTLFQDDPIPRNWGAPGTAINWRIFYIVEIATDVALDIFILCMPLPVIHRLHVNNKKKWLISGVFWLGAVIVVASTVRLYYMVKVKEEFQENSDDFSFTTINTIIWGSIEPCMSVIAACLPILGPVIFKKRRVDKFVPLKTGGVSSYIRRARSKKPSAGDFSRVLESIDKQNTHDESFMMSTIQSKSDDYKTLKDHSVSTEIV